MSSQFEKFVRENKDGFDSDVPVGNVWDRIEKNIAVKRKVFTLREVYKWTAVAAVFCVLLTSVYFLVLRKPATLGPVAKAEPATEISNFAPEYAGEARQIFHAIALGQQELQNKSKEEPKLYREFTADLKVLDSSYHELKKQAALSANRDIIIKAMLDNLKLQAELLRRQLEVMDNLKDTKPFTNEKRRSQSL